MTARDLLVGAVAAAAALTACGGDAKTSRMPAAGGTTTIAAATPEAAKPAPAPGPIGDRAALIRNAADDLDKAGRTLASGQKSVAEYIFSTVELTLGPEAVASLAPMFRDGAPPRVATPTIKVEPTAAPQPKVVGSSEAEDEKDKVAPPRIEGSLSGTVQIDGKPLTGAFGLVTLEPASGKWKPRTPKHVVIEQRGREFLPHLTAISVGSTIAFPNFDTVFHNVFSVSPSAGFDLGLYKMGEAREYTFQKEGIVRLGCNLHANMSAYIAIVSAPAYVVTDDTGHYAFKHLEPGKYKMKVWSERSKAPVSQDITIKQGKNDVDVGVSADAPTGPQADKFGGKRG
jgi:plastocyanin